GAAWTLRIMGPPAKDALTDLSAAVKDPVLRVREEAAMALANIDPHGEQHVPILLEALKDNDIFCRIGAANALQKIGGGGEEAAPTLEHVLVSDPNGGVRRFTAQALGLIGTPDALKALTRAAAQDKDETVRSEAILAIARSGRDYPPATEMMVRSLGDKVDSVRHAASWGLANLGPPAIPLLTAALKDPSPDIQVSAARVLAEIQPLSGNAVNVLLIAMKDQSNSLQLQSAAADALEDAGGAPRRAALAELQLVPQQAAAWREYFLRGQ
ncbi:MAG: HEAT repeat domain-containing protein, partial [Candidatus Binataceae bacterium]